MNTWKQALWLAKYELKASIASIIFCWISLSIICLLFSMSISVYLDSNYIGFDIFFILLFIFAPYYWKSKHFQYKKVSTNFWANPIFIMLLQLPINKHALVKSRLLIHLVYALPFAITVFPLLYFINGDVRNIMALSTYIAFVIIWLSFSVYFGLILAASDVGDYVTPIRWVYYSILVFGVFAGIIAFFHFYLQRGIVDWTIQLATVWPLQSIIISIILTILGWKYWQFYMLRTIKKLDYL